jgi:phosphomannomutase
MSLVRSISGLRATLGDSLTPDLVTAYTASYSNILPPGTIIVGRDGRPSGQWIEQIVAGTLAACGRKVKILGLAPTPTIQMYVEHTDAAGGIAITASHNPSEWNGLKFMDSEGVFLGKEENEKLWDLVDNNLYKFICETSPEVEYIGEKAIEFHIESILSLPYISDNIKKISDRKFKVVLDAVNASGSFIIKELLERFGCVVIPLFCDGSGIFPHTPEPLPENLSQLSQKVKESNADIGIAVDPDADRLVLIDGTGNPIGEEKTISIAIDSVLSNIDYFSNYTYSGAVVNLSTTRLARDIAQKYNAEYSMSPVGEINVVKLMKKKNALIGGEGSGGVIFPICHYGRDSLVGIALVLAYLAIKDTTLHALNIQYTAYEIVKKKFPRPESMDKVLSKIMAEYFDAEINTEDGIRIDLADSWVQLRASNTEPIIRIIAEAQDKDTAEQLIQNIRKICSL